MMIQRRHAPVMEMVYVSDLSSEFCRFESHPRRFALVTQLVEYLPCKQDVIGSSPAIQTYEPIAQLDRAVAFEAKG